MRASLERGPEPSHYDTNGGKAELGSARLAVHSPLLQYATRKGPVLRLLFAVSSLNTGTPLALSGSEVCFAHYYPLSTSVSGTVSLASPYTVL